MGYIHERLELEKERNMRSLVKCALAVGALACAPAFAQCDSPQVVEIPDGATSTLEQMLAAQSAVKTYLEEMNAYLDCLNGEIDALDEETPEETRGLMIERYNNGVTEMETVAANFNTQRVAYQEANKSK
jgi:hypothetical protein